MKENFFKKHLKPIIYFAIIFAIILIVNLILIFGVNKAYTSFFIVCLINFPFSILVYMTLHYLYNSYDKIDTIKKGTILSFIFRFLVVIFSLGLSCLFIYMVEKDAPTIYSESYKVLYYFTSPTILLTGYIAGMIFR